MFLTNKDMLDLIELRHDLHRHPEISGEEKETARRVRAFLEQAPPDRLLAGLGGHGVAAVYDSGRSGPSVLIRSEIDALPIHEKGEVEYRSNVDGKGHLCGHDGHSTILTALALGLARGLPFGHVSVVEGPVNCASRGIKITLAGKTAHASSPEHGISPMRAIARLMPSLSDLGSGFPPAPDFSMVTITHAIMGEAAFGISPADAEIWATLRTLTDDRMENLCNAAETLAKRVADEEGLTLDITYDDIFLHCENAPEAVDHIRQALDDEKISHGSEGLPMRASEDFGRFRGVSSSAMFFLGAGR
ncbi:MAG: amidohydrolase, partial [Rhizobium sp.]